MKRFYLLFIVFVGLISCEPENPHHIDDNSINSELSLNSTEIEKGQYFYNLSKNRNQKNNFEHEFVKFIDWSTLEAYNFKGNKVYEVEYQLKKSHKFEFKRYDVESTKNTLVLITNKDALMENYFLNISSSQENYDFKNLNFKDYKNPPNFLEGYVSLMNSNFEIVSFETTKKQKSFENLTKTEDQVTCIAFGYWYADGSFEPIGPWTCYSSGGSSMPEPDYDSGGGGSGSTSGDLSYEISGDFGPSCESFNFTNGTVNTWWDAAVQGIHFNLVAIDIKTLTSTATTVTLDGTTSFGMPKTYVNGDSITAGQAAEVSALVLQVSMDETVQHFGTTPASYGMLLAYFKERLQYNYPLMTNGGRVQFSSMNYTVQPTTYKTEMFGTGNCE